MRAGTADAEAALRSSPRSSRHLYNVARVFARAVAVAPADRHTPTRTARAVAVLREAVESLSESERPRFLNEMVRRDSAFQALVRTPGFVALAREFASSAKR